MKKGIADDRLHDHARHINAVHLLRHLADENRVLFRAAVHDGHIAAHQMQLLLQRHELYLWRRRNMQQLDQFTHHSVGAFRLMHGDQALDRQQRIVKEMRIDLRL